MILTFVDFELDEELYELRRAGKKVRLEPRAFDVLLYLVHHRDRVATKDEILEQVWSGDHVTDSVLPRAVNAIRSALEDDRTTPRFVVTVRGRGYRFLAEVEGRPSRLAAEPALEQDAQFIGRAAVRERIGRQLQHVMEGRGRVLVISGDAGIGKTTAFDWLVAEAQGRGALVATGRCLDSEGAPAYWPWTQVLRACEGEVEGGSETLTQAAPELAALFPDLSPAAPPLEAPDRFRLFESAVSVLRRASRDRPLVVGIEDLHWADVPSLILLQFVAQSIGTQAILLVATCRDLDLDLAHPLPQALGELVRQAHGRRVQIEGLPGAEVRELLSEILGNRARRALSEAVFEKTEGNPFFIREVAHMLADQGATDLESQLQLVRESIPRSVREVLSQRLANLPESCRDLLTLGAVVGRRFSVQLLERITGRSAEVVERELEPAFVARILVDASGSRRGCHFAHALFVEALYHEIPAARRPELHLQVAEGLEKLNEGEVTSILSELAWHFRQAVPLAPRERAIDYGLRAAKSSSRRLAYEKAAALCEGTLDLLDAGAVDDSEKRLEFLLLLGEERLRAGSQNRSRAAFLQAADIARELERTEDFAHAVIGCAGWSETAGQPDEPLRRLLEEALERVGSTNVALRIRLLGHLAGTDRYYRSREERGRLTEEAVALARELEEPAALCQALADRLVALQGPGETVAWLELSDECLALAEQTRNHTIRFRQHWYRFGTRLMQGDVQGARAECEEFERLRGELGLVVPEGLELRMRATLAMIEGRREDAVAHNARAFEIERRTGSRTAEASFFGMTAWLLKDWEELGQLEPWFDNTRHAYFDWADRPMEVMRQCVLHEVGRTAELRERFETLAEEGFAEAPRDQQWMTFMAEMSRLCASLADRTRGAELLELFESFSGDHVVETQLGVYGGPVDAYLGLLCELLGQTDAAVTYLEAARLQSERAGALVYRLRVEADLARVLHARGSSADRAQALDLAQRSQASARRLGLQRLEARMVALLEPA